jgi:hypothetical protein
MTQYRIYDHTSKNTLANAIPTLKLAQEVLGFLLLDEPDHDIQIESYTQQ